VFKLYSVKNHAAAVISCLDLILADQEFRSSLGLSFGAKAKLQSAKENWNTIKRRNETEARRLQRIKVRNGTFRNVPIQCIFEFLLQNSTKVETITRGWNDQVCHSTEELALVQAYCATVLALHGQRLVALLNLTAKDVMEAGKANGLYVIRIHDHKTSKSHGPAAVALRPKQFKILQGLAQYRRNLQDSHAALLQAPQGSASKALFAPLDEYIKARIPAWSGLTCNAVRATIESHNHLAATDRELSGKSINSYLLHSKQVTDLHYRFRTDAKVASDSLAVQDVLAQLLVMDLARAGKLQLPLNWRGEYSIKFEITTSN
jgi:hypothetical protein